MRGKHVYRRRRRLKPWAVAVLVLLILALGAGAVYLLRGAGEEVPPDAGQHTCTRR